MTLTRLAPKYILKLNDKKNVVFCVGIDVQHHPKFIQEPQDETLKKDAEKMKEAFITVGLDPDCVKVSIASKEPEDCKKVLCMIRSLNMLKRLKMMVILYFILVGMVPNQKINLDVYLFQEILMGMKVLGFQGMS